MKKAPGALRSGGFSSPIDGENHMVFGAELLLLGFVVFLAVAFLVLFFLVDFFAVLFLAGALLVVEVLGVDEDEPCAFATYGTVDVPTNASKANAEINAFILRYS